MLVLQRGNKTQTTSSTKKPKPNPNQNHDQERYINAKQEDSWTFPTVNFGCHFVSFESVLETLAKCRPVLHIK